MRTQEEVNRINKLSRLIDAVAQYVIEGRNRGLPSKMLHQTSISMLEMGGIEFLQAVSTTDILMSKIKEFKGRTLIEFKEFMKRGGK